MPFNCVYRIFSNKQFDDFDGDYRIILPVLDTILFQLHNRFKGIQLGYRLL